MTLNDRHRGKLFSIGMKMAEVPDADHRLLGVIRRLGLNFGFGEKTVGEVCEEAGVNPLAGCLPLIIQMLTSTTAPVTTKILRQPTSSQRKPHTTGPRESPL